MRSRSRRPSIRNAIMVCFVAAGLLLFVKNFPELDSQSAEFAPPFSEEELLHLIQPAADRLTKPVSAPALAPAADRIIPQLPPLGFSRITSDDELVGIMSPKLVAWETELPKVANVSHNDESDGRSNAKFASEALIDDTQDDDEEPFFVTDEPATANESAAQQPRDPLAGLLEMYKHEESAAGNSSTPLPTLITKNRSSIAMEPGQKTSEVRAGTPARVPTTAIATEIKAEPVAAIKSAVTPVRKTAWTQPITLTRQLEPLLEVDVVQPWAQQTLSLIDRLLNTQGIDDPAVADVLLQVEAQRQELVKLTNRIESRSQQLSQFELVQELRRINYRISRRLAIWYTAHQLASKDNAKSRSTAHSKRLIPVSARRLNFNVDPTWHEYLLIEEAESVFNSPTASESRQQKMARRMLSRALSPALSPEQHDYVIRALGQDVIEYLRGTACEEADFAGLLEDLESHEEEESGVTSYLLNSHYQNLFWADDEGYAQLASLLDTHYRNANVRFAVSENLINQMIPQLPSTNEPISERFMGADVYGQNQIHNNIRVQLIPDPSQIHMNLETQGEVHSVTRALKGGFTVDNQGTTRFQVFKRLAFGRNGVFSDRPVAVSSADQQVVDINSKYDPIPILGRVARRIARQKIEADAPETERMVRQRVERTASERIEEEVETQLNDATAYLQKNILQPLIAMDLDPDAQQMSTTREEIVMRYRLAGRDQMAANTARPRSVQGSLFNAQFHQSAINNLLMRIDLNGRTFTTAEMVKHVEDLLGVPVKSTVEQKAEFEFASLDPIRADFKDNRVIISLNLRSFQIGNGKRWKNLSVSSVYIPQVNGTTIELVQEKPGLHLTGKNLKLRDQLAVRTIFEAFFEESYRVSAVPEKLAVRLDSANLVVSQLVVENGWTGISVSDAKSKETSRSSRLLRRRR